jgi:hypothetical protein
MYRAIMKRLRAEGVLLLGAAAVAATFASTGCQTGLREEIEWQDVTGRNRLRSELETDYAKCRAERQRSSLEAAAASRATGDVAEVGRSDAAFLTCMDQNGWKRARRSAALGQKSR